MESKYVKWKINIWVFLILIFLIWFASYTTITINSVFSDYKSKIKDAKALEIVNNTKIEEKEIYIRLKQYGYKLSSIDNIINFKDSIVNWYEFLVEFRMILPKVISITTLNYSDETGKLTLGLVSPSEDSLLQWLTAIEEFKWLKSVEFNTINKEKLTFIWDKKQYVWFSTTLSVLLDWEYLAERYDTIRLYKNIKYNIWDSSNVMDITKEILMWTWTISEKIELLEIEEEWEYQWMWSGNIDYN